MMSKEKDNEILNKCISDSQNQTPASQTNSGADIETLDLQRVNVAPSPQNTEMAALPVLNLVIASAPNAPSPSPRGTETIFIATSLSHRNVAMMIARIVITALLFASGSVFFFFGVQRRHVANSYTSALIHDKQHITKEQVEAFVKLGESTALSIDDTLLRVADDVVITLKTRYVAPKKMNKEQYVSLLRQSLQQITDYKQQITNIEVEILSDRQTAIATYIVRETMRIMGMTIDHTSKETDKIVLRNQRLLVVSIESEEI